MAKALDRVLDRELGRVVAKKEAVEEDVAEDEGAAEEQAPAEDAEPSDADEPEIETPEAKEIRVLRARVAALESMKGGGELDGPESKSLCTCGSKFIKQKNGDWKCRRIVTQNASEVCQHWAYLGRMPWRVWQGVDRTSFPTRSIFEVEEKDAWVQAAPAANDDRVKEAKAHASKKQSFWREIS